MNPDPPILQYIRLATGNVRSVNYKSAIITDFVISKKLDILALTEPWLSPHDKTSCISYIYPMTIPFTTNDVTEISVFSFTDYFLCLYRPPAITSCFFVDFRDLLETLVTIHPEFIILGDFNLHLDTQSTATSTFNDILASCDLKHPISFSTHIHGHCLDLLSTRSTTDYIHTLTATDSLSDHFTVIAEI